MGSVLPPSEPPGVSAAGAEVHSLREELARERARRIAAESAGERATAALSESLEDLRAAQAELIERAEQARRMGELARSLRQDLDSRLLASRAAEAVVRLTEADRCEVLLVGLGSAPEGATVRGIWPRDRVAVAAARPGSDQLTDLLADVLARAAATTHPVALDDVAGSDLLGSGAEKVADALGAASLAVVPVAAGGEVVGWMLLESVRPRTWHERDLAMCESLSHDVVTSLLQVQAFEQQRESVRRLEDLDQAKDAFISTVSHELRTPLTSIVGYLEMMGEGTFGELGEDLRRGLDIVGRNVVRLRELVEDLLTLSAYDSQHMQLRLTAVDVVDMVEDCVVALEPLARAQEVTVALRVEGAPPRALGDQPQLERALTNVLTNAVKFSHRGGEVNVHVASRVDHEFADREVAVIEVSDHGIGIPVEEQGRLFTRFFRSSLAVGAEIPGTGLGLALVRTIVESHRGRVTVDSTEGVGTTVTISLPRSA